MTLRGRLTVLTAAVVAVAVVAFAFASWFFAKQQMMEQVKDNLQQNAVATTQAHYRLSVSSLCNSSSAFTQSKTVPTVFNASGGYWCQPVDSRSIVLTKADERIAASNTYGPTAQYLFREGHTLGHEPVLIYTLSLGEPVDPLGGSGAPIAVAFATSLAPVHRALNALAVILAVAALLVILAAAALALWVARAALRPVDQLTDAVEHVAQTEELGELIPVEGKDEIARLSESFNSMSTALAHSQERQRALIADAGHELRTPLTSLRTNVELLVRSEQTGRALPEETRSRMMTNMKAQMGELSTLIGDLLELSRPTRARGSRAPQVVALHEIAARALERARLRGPGLTFDTEIEPWYVRADPHTMERAVINLLDNAVKFSPPEGVIDVRLKFGTLTVRDRGPGIPAEDLPHVFDRFFRSPSARQLPGSGLGLAIVAQTVREAGGDVVLETVDPGARATLTLPGAPTPPPALPPSA